MEGGAAADERDLERDRGALRRSAAISRTIDRSARRGSGSNDGTSVLPVFAAGSCATGASLAQETVEAAFVCDD